MQHTVPASRRAPGREARQLASNVHLLWHNLTGADAMSTKRLSGKVVHDARGTAVWNWDVATGVLAQKTVAELISTLDTPGMLHLEGPDAAPARDWAGDPYNRDSG